MRMMLTLRLQLGGREARVASAFALRATGFARLPADRRSFSGGRSARLGLGGGEEVREELAVRCGVEPASTARRGGRAVPDTAAA